MSDPQADDEKPLDPAAARIVSRVRWMMAISALTTLIAVVAVLGVVSYRLLRSDGSASAADMTALLPKGARIVSTAVAETASRSRSTSTASSKSAPLICAA